MISRFTAAAAAATTYIVVPVPLLPCPRMAMGERNLRAIAAATAAACSAVPVPLLPCPSMRMSERIWGAIGVAEVTWRGLYSPSENHALRARVISSGGEA